MPELPEVETVRRSLLPLVGGRITGVDVREPNLRLRLPDDFARRIHHLRIEALQRRGKYLLFGLSNGETLLAHLGMTGTLLLRPTEAPPSRHDHVRFRIDTGGTLVFNDPRRFGSLRLGPLDSFGEIQHIGPEPLDEAFTPATLHAVTRGRKKPIKTLLMDQSCVAGIGNIYASEILFGAGLRPTRAAHRLTRSETARLHAAMRQVLDEAVALGGSTISDYRDGHGRTGYFQLTFRVYGRDGEDCTSCRQRIRRIIQAGRSSFYCRSCQH